MKWNKGRKEEYIAEGAKPGIVKIRLKPVGDVVSLPWAKAHGNGWSQSMGSGFSPSIEMEYKRALAELGYTGLGYFMEYQYLKPFIYTPKQGA